MNQPIVPTGLLGNRPLVLRLNSHETPAIATADDNGGQIAISPDGMTVVYPGAAGSLHLRNIASPDARTLVKHWGSRDAFFSPDGKWIGYFAGLELRRTTIAGDETETLIKELPGHAKGGCFTKDGIVYSPTSNAGLWRIPAAGGEPVQITRPDQGRGELSHRWPCALPGGRKILFTIKTREIESFDDAKVAVLDTSTGKWKTLVDGGTSHPVASRRCVIHGE